MPWEDTLSIVDELRECPGRYKGRGWFAPGDRPPREAELVLRCLPGASGVAMDYEVLGVEGQVLHKEHSMLVTPGSGPAVLLIAFEGDDRAALLREIEPGLFAEAQSEPYRESQMAVRIEALGGGTIRHAYCWADADGRFVETDVAELRQT